MVGNGLGSARNYLLKKRENLLLMRLTQKSTERRNEEIPISDGIVKTLDQFPATFSNPI